MLRNFDLKILLIKTNYISFLIVLVYLMGRTILSNGNHLLSRSKVNLFIYKYN